MKITEYRFTYANGETSDWEPSLPGIKFPVEAASRVVAIAAREVERNDRHDLYDSLVKKSGLPIEDYGTNYKVSTGELMLMLLMVGAL
jgi:hypothetical protein